MLEMLVTSSSSRIIEIAVDDVLLVASMASAIWRAVSSASRTEEASENRVNYTSALDGQSSRANRSRLRDASCGLWAAPGDVVADRFEVVRGVLRPPDAH